jgi:hypothetical protein
MARKTVSPGLSWLRETIDDDRIRQIEIANFKRIDRFTADLQLPRSAAGESADDPTISPSFELRSE